jgi:hypothetical protein
MTSDPDRTDEISIEALVLQIAGLSKGGHLVVTYGELEQRFPPGIEDDAAKDEIIEFFQDCFCDVRDVREYRQVVLTKTV